MAMMVKLSRIRKMKMDRGLRIMKNANSGLHSTLALTLLCSRVIGLLPVAGLWNRSSHAIRFTLKSPYTLIYVITISGQFILSIMSFYWFFENGITLPNVTNALFYGSSLVTSLILLKTGWAWPQFISKVEQGECVLPPFTRNVKKYCNVITFVILFMALIEHAFSIIYGQAIAAACNSSRHHSEMFFIYNMPWIFYYIPFDWWKGILFEIFNIQSTFMWSYNDLIIMVLSIYLSEHFYLHYRLLKRAIERDNFCADTFRVHYMTIVKIVKLINKRFGIVIVTTFGFNLYWICTQLFYTLNKNTTGHVITFNCKSEILNNTLHGVEHSIYFAYSFSFLVARMLLVLFLAARVNSASTAPLMLLYEMPYTKYCVEVERYVDQINNLKVAMSGLGFFYVTRTMILTAFALYLRSMTKAIETVLKLKRFYIALLFTSSYMRLVGSIITYELVLLQFNK